MAPPGRDWNLYYRQVEGRPPRPLLQRAVALMDGPGAAVDLGCGDGTDTRFLARRGWQVFAVDATPDTARRVVAGLDPAEAARVTARDGAFGDLDLLPPSDLVHAGYSLPFGTAAELDHVATLVQAALRPGGLFVGQLFGDRDEWVSDPGVLTHTRAQAEDYVGNWDVVVLEESEFDRESPHGDKHWHLYDFIVRMP